MELEEGLGPEWFYGGITFTDEKQGWAAVYHWIFHTEDGGQTWKLQFDTGKTSQAVSKIDFRDALNGCVAGWSVICTNDGGKTWSERLGAASNDDEGLGGVSLIGQSDGWTVGRLGRIYKTADGGRSWKIAVQSNKCGGSPFFVNKQTGWLYNWWVFNNICRTDDGGHTWEQLDVGVKVKGIFFIDDKTGWVVGMIEEWKNGKDTHYSGDRINAWSVIKHTTDGGKTWETQYKETMGTKLFSELLAVFFINPNTGWVVGDKGVILHTEDGGKHWLHQKSGNIRNSLSRVQFLDTKIGWITGVRFGDRWTGIILNTSDGGKHWTLQHTQEAVTFNDLVFLDKSSGWVSGHSETGEFGVLIHTVDSGATWLKSESSSIDYNHMAFLDKERGAIFSGETGFVLITADGGKTWKRRRIPLKKAPWHFSEIFEKPDMNTK